MEKSEIDALFGALSEGHGFAITRATLVNVFNGDVGSLVAALPQPDYEHSIWLDEITDNVLVVRPNREGRYVYEDGTPIKFGKRLR